MKIDYEVVKIKGVKKGKCIKCGKYTARQKIFWQTLNPFNKNKKGFPNPPSRFMPLKKNAGDMNTSLATRKKLGIRRPGSNSYAIGSWVTMISSIHAMTL